MRRALLIAAVLAAVAAPAARADGDPASDVLLSQDVYVPYYGKLPKPSTEALASLAKQAKKKGYTVRVALIDSQYDLGSVGVFWKKPKPYAKFLGQELSATGVYRDRVLTVMPNGFGISRNGQALPDEQKVLDALPSPEAQQQDIATAALTAVQKLAAAKGTRLNVVIPKEASSSSGFFSSDRLRLIGIALLVIAVGVAVEIARRLRRSRRALPES